MDVALFMYMFYARHAKKKTSGADTHTFTRRENMHAYATQTYKRTQGLLP